MILQQIVENKRKEVEKAKKLGLIDNLEKLAEQRFDALT